MKPAANSICFLGEDVCESGRRVMAGMNQIDVSLYYLWIAIRRQSDSAMTTMENYCCGVRLMMSSCIGLLAAGLGGCSDKNDIEPAPNLSEAATYSGTSLELYYNGEQMPGKRAVVKVTDDVAELAFDSSFDLSMLTGMGLTGELPAPGVTPGDSRLVLTASAKPGDGAYVLSGEGATDYVTFDYSGRVEKDKMVFNLSDVKLANQSLSGSVFAPAPIEGDMLSGYSSMPFHLVWELDPMAGIDIPLSDVLRMIATAPVIPVYEGTAYTSVAQAFYSLVKTIALTGSGNMPVMYVSTLGGASHVATTCGNMLQYVPSESGIRLYLNPLQVVSEALLALSDNKDDAKFDFSSLLKRAPSVHAEAAGGDMSVDPALTRAMIGVFLKALAPQIEGGIPLTVSPSPSGADIYLDTAASVTFLSTLLRDALQNHEILAKLQDYLTGASLPGVNPENLSDLLQKLPQYLMKTTRLEIGLSLVRR